MSSRRWENQTKAIAFVIGQYGDASPTENSGLARQVLAGQVMPTAARSGFELPVQLLRTFKVPSFRSHQVERIVP